MNKKELLNLIDEARKNAIFSKDCTNAKETFMFFTDLKSLLNKINDITNFVKLAKMPGSVYTIFSKNKYCSVKNIEAYSTFNLKYKNAFKVLNETLEDYIK